MRYSCYAFALVLLLMAGGLLVACCLYPVLRLDTLQMAALTCALGYGVLLCGEIIPDVLRN